MEATERPLCDSAGKMRHYSRWAVFRVWAKSAAALVLCIVLSASPDRAVNCHADEDAPGPPIAGTDSETVSVAGLLLKRLDAIRESRVESVQPLRNWAETTKRQLSEVAFAFGRNDLKDAEAKRTQLELSTIQLADFRKSWTMLRSESTKKEDYVPTLIVLEELQLGLERWVLLWQQSIAAAESDAFPLAKLFSKGTADVQQLAERTQAAQDFLLGEKRTVAKGLFVGELWSRHLAAAALLDDLETYRKMAEQLNRQVAAQISTIPIPLLVSLSDRANAILAKLDETVLTDAQKQFLDVPAVTVWKEELRTWTSDTVSPLELLAVVDAYETTAGTSDMARLHGLVTRLLVSQSPAFRQLGRLAAELYGGPNIKVYISRVFLNRLLPVNEPEEEPFREMILGQPVFGKRRVEKEVELNLIPADDQLLLSLDVRGSVQTSSRANAFATTLFNNGQADYTARKQIELTADGFLLSPSQVAVKNNRVLLKNIRTEFDQIPILSGVFREIVLGQYESRRSAAKAEAGRKIARQAKNRIDSETEGKFNEINDKFRSGMLETLKQLGLSIEKQNAKTESDWLLSSWRMVGDGVLSGSTPAPTTQPGSFADLKVHESAINALIGKLDIGGREMSAGEFRQEIAAKFLKPEFVDDDIDDDEDVEIAFASENPVVVRFADGRAEITVAVESIKVQRQTFRNFKGIVAYRPLETPDGRLFLQRDGIVSYVNVPAQLRTRIALGAVFGKMFPTERPLALSPKLFETDPRFTDLKTGLCQLEKGWLSIALIARE